MEGIEHETTQDWNDLIEGYFGKVSLTFKSNQGVWEMRSCRIIPQANAYTLTSEDVTSGLYKLIVTVW